MDGGLGESPRKSVPNKVLPPCVDIFAMPPLAFVIVLVREKYVLSKLFIYDGTFPPPNLFI